MGLKGVITVEHDKAQDELSEGFRSAIKEAQDPDNSRFPFCTEIFRGKVRLTRKLVTPSKTFHETLQNLDQEPGSPFQPDHVTPKPSAFITGVLGAIIFGYIHLGAWNFPSQRTRT